MRREQLRLDARSERDRGREPRQRIARHRPLHGRRNPARIRVRLVRRSHSMMVTSEAIERVQRCRRYGTNAISGLSVLRTERKKLTQSSDAGRFVSNGSTPIPKSVISTTGTPAGGTSVSEFDPTPQIDDAARREAAEVQHGRLASGDEHDFSHERVGVARERHHARAAINEHLHTFPERRDDPPGQASDSFTARTRSTTRWRSTGPCSPGVASAKLRIARVHAGAKSGWNGGGVSLASSVGGGSDGTAAANGGASSRERVIVLRRKSVSAACTGAGGVDASGSGTGGRAGGA